MKILYIMSSYNIYGGTPKKTLDLIQHSENDCYLYMYEDGYNQFKYLFEEAGANITEGYYRRNFFKHINSLLKVIDKNDIQLIQTQFTMGEVLGFLIKYFRPHVKLIIAFVGSFEPKIIKKIIVQEVYKKVDAFVFISNFVKEEKIKSFPYLSKQFGKVIYNGTLKREKEKNKITLLHPAILDIASLNKIKNISVLIDIIGMLKHQREKEYFLYVAGDGPERGVLEKKIKEKHLEENIKLLGNQKNIGQLLEECDIFVHPSFAEGFGIAVAEAMIAKKPIIVSNSGALPELIENNKSGLLVDPFNIDAWVEAILKMTNNEKMAKIFAKNAKQKAEEHFSIEKYVKNYQDLYISLLDKKINET